MDEQQTKARLTAILDSITADVRRLEAGDDAVLDPRTVALEVDEAVKLAADHRTAGLVIDQTIEDRARELLPLVEAQVRGLRDARDVQAIIYKARAAGDLPRLHAISLACPGTISQMARSPLSDFGSTVSAIRGTAASWREQSRRTPEQRAAAVRLQQQIADERQRRQDEADRPRPRAGIEYSGFL